DLVSAEKARLVSFDSTTGHLMFRHPLIRSVVVDMSTVPQRRRAHATLAGLAADEPDQRAWHLGAATMEPDETVAGLLEQSAHRMLRRGDAVGTVAALTRAAELSPDRGDRGRRLAEAAYVGADLTGALKSVSQVLQEIRNLDPNLTSSLQAAVASAFMLLNGDGDVPTAHRLLVGAVEQAIYGEGAESPALEDALY